MIVAQSRPIGKSYKEQLIHRKAGDTIQSTQTINTPSGNVIPMASPILNQVGISDLNPQETKIFTDMVTESTTGEFKVNILGHPTSTSKYTTAVPSTETVTIFVHEDSVPFFTLYLVGIVLFYLYTAACGIAAMVGIFALVNDFNIPDFLLATSIIGAFFFFISFGSWFRYGHMYQKTSPKHNKAMIEPLLTMSLYGLIAWISLFVWTKDYDDRHVNTHAPNELNRFYVAFSLYVVAWIASSMTLGGFLVASLNVEKEKPDLMVFNDKNKVFTAYGASELSIMKEAARSQAQDNLVQGKTV